VESGAQTGPPPPAGVQIGVDLSRDIGQTNHIRRSAPPDHAGDNDDFWALLWHSPAAGLGSRQVQRSYIMVTNDGEQL
jgi:hypothetical protein